MRVLAFLLTLLAAAVKAEDIEVDAELFLAVDVSRSMAPEELELQRRGYAEALASDEVVTAIEKGLLGRIALTYVKWAGVGSQRVIVPWTLVADRSDAEAVAARLTAQFDPSLRRTSISSALDHAAQSFETNGFESWRRVIDVSGDGPNNQGEPVLEARARALESGAVINGLPLMTSAGVDQFWRLEDLDVYYERCVIGGPGAFVIPVREWSQFPLAVRRKIVLEIAGPPLIQRAQFTQPAPYDCLIGEKMWEQRRRYWDNP